MCCGFNLTPEELYFYGYKCEQCTQQDQERLEKWKAGGEDKQLDKIYGKRDARPRTFNA